MLRVAESSDVPALKEWGISSRPALRENFFGVWSASKFCLKRKKMCLYIAGLLETKCA